MNTHGISDVWSIKLYGRLQLNVASIQPRGKAYPTTCSEETKLIHGCNASNSTPTLIPGPLQPVQPHRDVEVLHQERNATVVRREPPGHKRQPPMDAAPLLLGCFPNQSNPIKQTCAGGQPTSVVIEPPSSQKHCLPQPFLSS